MTLPRLMIFAILVAIYPWGTVAAQSLIVGVASVIDGDTLDIHGQRIRLHGIDAPESGQLCEKNGKHYRCGQQAALALANKIGRATVQCEQRDIDRYKRIVAVCRLGKLDINAWLVLQGWAIAYRQYSRDYVDDESAARVAKMGMWAGSFLEPSRWRRGDRMPTESVQRPPADSCQIKGNISRSGDRIFHVPGARDYEATRIDISKGERWFCSEYEARKAGWRRSQK
jgi:endonuclease YncB( thermonuclease family)